MGKKTKSKGKQARAERPFFQTSALKTQREVDKGRELLKKQGNKGFIKQLENAQKTSPELKEAQEKRELSHLYIGEDVSPQSKPDGTFNPKPNESAPTAEDEGIPSFTQMHNWRRGDS